MAFKLCGLHFALFFQVSVFAAGDGHYKGFARLNQVQNTKHEALFDEQWFIQKLDHFSGADTRVWKQVSVFM